MAKTTQQDLTSKIADKAAKATPSPGAAQVPATVSQSVAAFLEKNKHELEKALPTHVNVDRLNRLLVSAINRNPTLGQCTMPSLVGCYLASSQLGLEVNAPLGYAWVIPYQRSVKVGDKWQKVWEAQFQIGYQGLVKLAWQSGMFDKLYVESVHENDEFDFALGLNKHLDHKPASTSPGKLIGIYACYHLKGGASDFKYWSIDRIMEHAKKYSKSWDESKGAFKAKSAWAENFEGMARVPVLKDLLKIAPKSVEFHNQLTYDGLSPKSINELHERVDPDTGEILDGEWDEVVGEALEESMFE